MEYFIFTSITALANFYKNKRIFYISIFILIVVLSLRGSEDEYSGLVNESFPLDEYIDNFFIVFSVKGPIINLLTSFIANYNLTTQLILLFYVPITFFFFFRIVYLNTILWNVALLMCLAHSVLITSMSGLRMGLSASLSLLMIHLVSRGKPRSATAVFVISLLNHYAALFSVLIFFLKRKKKFLFYVGGLIVAFAIYILDIPSFILPFFGRESIVTHYINTNVYVYNVGVLHPKTIQQIVTFIILLLYVKNRPCLPPFFQGAFNAYFLSTFLLISLAGYALFAFRLSALFIMVEPIILSTLFFHYFKKPAAARFVLYFVLLMISYLNYVILVKIEPYDFLVRDIF